MLRPSVLVLALVLSSRAWWVALVDQQMPVLTALIWFIVAVPLAGLALAGLRSLNTSYKRQRRANDAKSRPH